MKIINTEGSPFQGIIPAAFEIDEVIEGGQVVCRVLFYGRYTCLDLHEIAEKAINDVYLKCFPDMPRENCKFYMLFTANPLNRRMIFDYELVIENDSYRVAKNPERTIDKNEELAILALFSEFIVEAEGECKEEANKNFLEYF